MKIHFASALRSDFDVFRADDTASAEIRSKQLRALVRMTPFAITTNVLNGALAWFALRPSAHGYALTVWATALAAVSFFGAKRWWQHRHVSKDTVSPRAIRRAVLHASILALIWAALAVLWFPSGSPSQRLILAMLTTGMLGGGAIILAPIPMASIAYVVVLATGASIAILLTREPPLYYALALVSTYSISMIVSAIITARASIARHISERESAQQHMVIGLLLRDFEEHSADVLWETDCDGAFTHVSAKLAQLLGYDQAQLQGTNLLGLIEQSRGTTRVTPHESELRSALQSGRPFRDLVVPVDVSGTTRWWSLTAKPLVNDDGLIVGWRGVVGDVSERQEAQERLEYLAQYDPLTGLANRRQLRDRLQAVLDSTREFHAERHGTPSAALLFIDVDQFKNINDTLGHAAGDVVLQRVAHRLSASSRIDDFIVRLGGDEFALLVDSTSGETEITALCERLMSALRAPSEIAGQTVVVNASIGVAIIPTHGTTVDEVLGNADLALYAAKESGRDQFQIFVPALGERSRRRKLVEQELRHALDRDELSLHWQPQFAAGTAYMRGAEALLRWTHPRLGNVLPAEFIPIAEEAGLVEEIGRWVLIKACSMASHQLAGMPVSVNVSPRQLLRDDFVSQVQQALILANLPATRLEIEITESLFMDEVPVALRHLHELRASGVRIALDDFGTGYSSLAYLRRFPFDTLKIDRAFIRELTHQNDAKAIVKMIVELATTLGMDTVAECVEEHGQASILRDVGCRALQGYLLARPMPVGELQTLLRSTPTRPGLKLA